MTKFVSTENKGCGITFQNGFTISIQWGTMNYCEKQNLGVDLGNEGWIQDVGNLTVTQTLEVYQIKVREKYHWVENDTVIELRSSSG